MHLLPYLLMLALINSCIELEISAPSFPNIMAYFGVSESVVGLTITMNLVGFCIAAIVYGPLADRYGRRQVMLVGNGILTIGAMLCVLAPTMSMLLFARLIQGVGAATSAVVVSAIIADRYKTEQASRLYGMMNAVFTCLMALAPVLGGAMNSIIGWRGNYGVIAGICLVSWVMLMLFLPETSKGNKKLNVQAIRFDYKTLILNPRFVIAAAIPSLLYGCYMAFVAIGPFIYRQTLGLTLFSYTLHTAIVVASFAMTSLLYNPLANTFGQQKTLKCAMRVQLMGVILMCFSKTALQFTGSMCVFSIGFAIIYPTIFARSMEIFPDMKGTASSAIMSLRYLICAGLTFVCGQVFNGSLLSFAIILLVTSIVIVGLGLSQHIIKLTAE